MAILIRTHKSSCRDVIAICDAELNGKIIEGIDENGNELQVDLTGNFFRGEEKTADEIKEMIEEGLMEDACFNIAGKKSIELCKKLGLIKEHGIIKINNVPFALTLL